MDTKSGSQEKALVINKERVLMGIQAIDFIQHGTETALDIVTPLGQHLSFKSTFIGFDGQHSLFFTLPTVSKNEYEDFFVEGFNVDIEGICEEGEGALVRFRTCIDHVIFRPIQVLVLPLPQQAKFISLRNELRYQLHILGDIQLSTRKLQVVLTDLSSAGCGFTYDAISPVFDIGSRIFLEVSDKASGGIYGLSGTVKNAAKKRGRQVYGFVFDEPGKANCKRLLSTLIYDGNEYVFKNTKKQ